MNTEPDEQDPPLYVEDVRHILEQLLDDLEDRLVTRLVEILRHHEPSGDTIRMITERDMAEMLKCDRRTVRRLERGGVIPPALRIGGSKRWRLADIQDWLAAMTKENGR